MMSGERRFLTLRVWGEIMTNSTKTTVTAAVKTTTTTSLHFIKKTSVWAMCKTFYRIRETHTIDKNHKKVDSNNKNLDVYLVDLLSDVAKSPSISARQEHIFSISFQYFLFMFGKLLFQLIHYCIVNSQTKIVYSENFYFVAFRGNKS